MLRPELGCPGTDGSFDDVGRQTLFLTISGPVPAPGFSMTGVLQSSFSRINLKSFFTLYDHLHCSNYFKMLRRSNPWDPPTFIDRLLLSPLALFIDYIHALILTLRGPSVKPPKNKPPIRFVCISDTHDHKVELPAGDVLIHAGDLTNSGTTKDIQAQLDWLESLPGFKYKILVAGNHDSFFDAKSRKEEDKGRKLNFHKLHFLQNETLQIKLKGGRTLTVYGAADIPRCGGSDFA